MLYSLLEFLERLNSNTIRIPNSILDRIIRSYTFLEISEKISFENNQDIYHKLSESKIIIINHLKEMNPIIDDRYLFIGFKQTVIIIDQTKLSFLSNLFSSKQNLIICFLSDSKDIFNHSLKVRYTESGCSSKFITEIFNFNKKFSFQQLTKSTLKKIWELMQPCISGYLIKQSYNAIGFDRIHNFFNRKFKMNENEYIELRTIKKEKLFTTKLIYYIKEGELFVIKKLNNFEISNSVKQEVENYLKLNHPFLPKFYGMINDTNHLLFEFINGQKLTKIKRFHLDGKDKIKIIFEIMIIIEFLYRNHFTLIELKPENILIDQYKNIVLINFDLIMKNDDNEEENILYSLGQIMQFIMKEENEFVDFERYSKIEQLFKKCTTQNNLSISDLIDEFYMTYNAKFEIEEIYNLNSNNGQIHSEKEILNGNSDSKSEIDINESINFYLQDSNQDNPNAQFNLGVIYSENKYVPRDMKKALHFYSIASNLNDIRSQFNLGYIYWKGELVPRDIKKAIYYYSLAASQNDSKAQLNLGDIYFEGEFVPRDMKKAIHYYTLAANQNCLEAQFKLGLIYSDDQYVKKDIKKAIYYYSLASMQNSVEAQFNLGFIYSEGADIERDINKAIHYYTLASRQNDPRAQFNLGVIFSEGVFIEKDVNKAIYFYSLAAKQNVVEAQFNLAFIYSEDKDVPRDVDKMIYFYSLAADLNDPRAQFNLGVIYYEGRYVRRDVDKAIHYYSLAAEQNIPEAQYNLDLISRNNHY
ncbi:hypothetical protein M9Y10_042662 [Tritrichomonas musculus]|uniref:Protein kinase domain-containing protein n=1 Tax=Tritrichomonas musculus TaxID=1915356 RepID=A0ABR2JXL6_9EUKA